MKYTAAFVLDRTTDLVARFRNRPRTTSVAFTPKAVRSITRKARPSTEMLVRRLVQPVLRRRNSVAV